MAGGEVGIVFIVSVSEAGAVGWATPEDRRFSAGNGLSEEGVGEIFAVEFLGRRGPSEGVERTVEIDGGENRGVVGGPLFIGWDEARSPDDEGRADPAFIHPGLGSAKWTRGAGPGFVAIIRADRDDSVVPEFWVVTDSIEKAGELFVHGTEHAVIEGTFIPSPFVKRWPEGAVDVIGPEVNIEGSLIGLALVDKLQGFVHEASGDFGALHPLKTLAEALGIGPDFTNNGVAPFRIGLEGEGEKLGADTFEVSQTLMETVIGDFGCVSNIALASHVPFAEVARLIAGLLELAGEGRGLGVEPLSHAAFFVIASIIEVGGDTPAMRVLSGGEGDTGGRADGRVDIEVGELNPFRGETVDMLGFDGAAEAGEVRVAHVIDEDDDYVGPSGRGS